MATKKATGTDEPQPKTETEQAEAPKEKGPTGYEPGSRMDELVKDLRRMGAR